MTMPPSEITATSVVPPPMSTIIEPVGSATGRPAPTAAAIGSPITKASAAPDTRQAAAGPRRRRLLDQGGLGSAGREAGLLDRPLLYPGNPGGDADDHPRVGK